METIDFCKVNRQATPEFNFYQQIDLIWKKQGFISSTSAFLCKVNIGIRPGDERTLTAMSILNQNSLLLNRGISTFTLKMTNPIETVLNLSPSFEYLNGINKSGLLVNLSRESAIVSLGVSFSKLDDASFAAIFNFIKKSGTEALLDRYFSVKMGFYSLNQVATETKLVIKGQSSVEFDL